MRKAYLFLTALLVPVLLLVTGAVIFAQSPYLITSASHLDVVRGARLNAAGTQILSWSSDSTAQVSEAIIGGASLFLMQHQDGINGATWNQAETQILTWSQDGTARLWDATSGEQLVLFQGSDDIVGATWSADETVVLTWATDGTIRLWDPTSGDQLTQVQHTDAARGAVLSNDNTTVLSYAADGTIFISAFDGATLTTATTLPSETGVLGATWNPARDRVISWNVSNNNVTVWDTTTARQVASFAHAGQVNGAAWSTDGTRILTWSEDGSARIYQSGVAPIIMAHGSPVTSARFVADDTRVLTIVDGRVTVWDAANGTKISEIDQTGVAGLGAALSNNGNLLATWGEDGNLNVWDTASALLLANLTPGAAPAPVRGAIWNADDSRILSWGDDSMAHLWDALIFPQF